MSLKEREEEIPSSASRMIGLSPTRSSDLIPNFAKRSTRSKGRKHRDRNKKRKEDKGRQKRRGVCVCGGGVEVLAWSALAALNEPPLKAICSSFSSFVFCS